MSWGSIAHELRSKGQFKVCDICGRNLPLINFESKRCKYCDDCKKEIKKARRHNISHEIYERIIEEQNGLCKICGENKKLEIDHDHKTGTVRGLLCRKCNMIVGIVEKDFTKRPDFFDLVINYLTNNSKT
jgi:hypothetical protein